MYGIWCPDEASVGAGSLCGDWLTALDGQECGEAGDYSVSASQEIPDSDHIPDNLWSFVRSTVTIYMQLGGEDECEGNAENNTSYSMAGMALVAVGAAAYVAKRRRDAGDDDDKVIAFIEMRDDSAIV